MKQNGIYILIAAALLLSGCAGNDRIIFLSTFSNSSSNSTSDGNNYTQSISFYQSGTTNILELQRFGMQNLTATFQETEPSWTGNASTVSRTGTAQCTGTNSTHIAVAQNTSSSVNGPEVQCTYVPISSGTTTLPRLYITLLAAAQTDTNAPLAEQVFSNTRFYTIINLTGYTEFRFGVSRSATDGAAGYVIYPKYRNGVCNSATPSSYTNLSTSNPSLNVTAANLAQVSTYYSLASGAQTETCISFFTRGGDGALDPQFRSAWIEFR